jgi:hypothetical protein
MLFRLAMMFPCCGTWQRPPTCRPCFSFPKVICPPVNYGIRFSAPVSGMAPPRRLSDYINPLLSPVYHLPFHLPHFSRPCLFFRDRTLSSPHDRLTTDALRYGSRFTIPASSPPLVQSVDASLGISNAACRPVGLFLVTEGQLLLRGWGSLSVLPLPFRSLFSPLVLSMSVRLIAMYCIPSNA